MAARPTIDVHPPAGAGRRGRPVPLADRPAGPPAPAAPPLRRRPWAPVAVWGLVAAYAGAFAWLSVARHHAFATGRFDLGNMVQAVWSTAEGRPLETTDMTGAQIVRLGAHVDPILALLTPLWWLWSSPQMLLVVQAVVVALGALPAFWLGRRWLGDDRLAVAGAALYLLFPGLQHAVLFDVHPVTLAAPLLMFCIWAAEEARWVALAACATLAALTQEQVGAVLVGLAVWMAIRHPGRRRAAAALGAAAAAWVVVALTVVIPAFSTDGRNPHIGRYGHLGDTPLEILRTFATRPWDALAVIATPGRIAYLAALLLPLLLLPLLAPLLLGAALPQLLINLFASTGPPQTVEYHYTVVIVPFLVAAALLGLARARRWRRPAPLARLLRRPALLAGVLVGAVILAGARQGPLPVWGWLPLGWPGSPLHQFTVDDHARALSRAVAMVPPDAAVSATNSAGAHLSERERILLFPEMRGADWVLVDDSPRTRAAARDRPSLRPPELVIRLVILETSPTWRLVFDEEGVRLFRRRVPAGA